MKKINPHRTRLPRLLRSLTAAALFCSTAFSGQRGDPLVSLWLKHAEHDVPNKCGLPALTFGLENKQRLAPEASAALNRMLSRPTVQKSVLRGRFRIHYDTSGVHEPALLDAQRRRVPNTANAYADSVGTILEYAYRLEVDSLGFLPPPTDDGSGGGAEYDIYIQDLPDTYYGYTTPETPINNKPSGGTFTSFITIDNDFTFVMPTSNQGLPALRVTLAHELHHAIQMGNHGYWGGDIFFYEITSVWMEDIAFTDVNDYYQYTNSSSGHFAQPQISFAANDFIMYSRSIWCHFLAKRFGRDVVRQIWQEIGSERPLAAMDVVLGRPEHASSFRSAYSLWSKWNYFTGARNDSVKYYPEGSHYRSVAASSVDFSPPSRMIVGNLSPCASRYYDVNGSLRFVVTNTNFDAANVNENQTFPYSVDLNSRQVDNTYTPTKSQIFVKLDVSDRANWFFNDLFGVIVNSPFPNPFFAGEKRYLYFPVSSSSPISASVNIYSTSMDLMISESQTSVFHPDLDVPVFRWDGRNENGDLVGSGIYFFVIQTPTGTNSGKVAVIRR